MAHELGLTVGELRERITDTEFLNWQAYFYLRDRRHYKQDYYLASIAHRINAVHGGKGKLENFLLRFKEPRTTPESPEEHEQMWLALVSGGSRNQEIQTGEEIGNG